MIRNQKRHIQQGVPDLVDVVGNEVAFPAKVLQFIDQVKKQKQGQKTERYQGDRAQYFAINKAANGFQALTPLSRTESVGRSRRRAGLKTQFELRLTNHRVASRNTPPCKARTKLVKLMRPTKIQL